MIFYFTGHGKQTSENDCIYGRTGSYVHRFERFFKKRSKGIVINRRNIITTDVLRFIWQILNACRD